MTFNLATLWEAVADSIPDRDAIVIGARRSTFADIEERANRLANHLLSADIGPGDHVGIQLLNSTEFIEAMMAAFKIRAVPINVNYRYVEGELAYLFADADLRALVYHREFGPKIASVLPKVESLTELIAVEDGSDEELAPGSITIEAALAAASADRPDGSSRTGDDHYVVYTGGTTGMPKGVVWRHEDIFFASLGGGDVATMGNHVTGADELAERAKVQALVTLPTPPLMHASAQWVAMQQLFGGSRLVFVEAGKFDAATIWRLVTDEKVNIMVIVGDAMGRPLMDELEANADAYNVDSLIAIGSGGAILSPATKKKIMQLLPNRLIADGLGSSETGVIGNRRSGAGSDDNAPATFTVNDQTAVLDDDGHRVGPGSGVSGRLARRGHIPLGYYNDPEKTAKTFIVVDGERWVLPGDMATVETDGTITLLGRGSLSINTGGEKVYPEEVEQPLKSHPAIRDAVVVGVPDDRWGERVVAVIELNAAEEPSLKDVQGHLREHIAGYKVPRQLVVVDQIARTETGKADYKWAKEQATAAM